MGRARLKPLAERLEAGLVEAFGPPRSDLLGLAPCRVWTGQRSRGYGKISVGGRGERVHRVVWRLAHGPLSARLDVRHRCDNAACAELSHLRPGTRGQNMGDGAARDRTWWGRQRACVHGHPFDEKNTHWRPSGGRACRTCKLEQQQRRRAAA
jgi:hypothetical protein